MDGHRRCSCGSFGELIGTMHSAVCFIRCPNCGAKGPDQRTPFRAWLAWDNGELDKSGDNMTIYEAMEQAEGVDDD